MTKSTNPDFEEATGSQEDKTCCPVVELRQYTLYPGKREILIQLFDREFVESQELEGMSVLAQFRDLENANRFVWLRGFRNMSERAEGLKAFYTGAVWKAHREAANATMIDSDNVLLLRPAGPRSGLLVGKRPPPGATIVPKGLVVATIYYLERPADDDFIEFFEGQLKPALMDSGVSILGYFVTEHSANNFPALPVREGESVFIWFSCFSDQAAYADHLAALANLPLWTAEVSEALARKLVREPEVLKLSPTARSRLRC